MALNAKKREAKLLKSDQMIEELEKNNAPKPETSSNIILDGLNQLNNKSAQTKTIEETKKTEETEKTEEIEGESKSVNTSKAGKKKVYESDRFLIHVRVDEELKEKIDSAVFARKQTMQDYIMGLILQDMDKNGDKYKRVYESMLEFQRNFK